MAPLNVVPYDLGRLPLGSDGGGARVAASEVRRRVCASLGEKGQKEGERGTKGRERRRERGRKGGRASEGRAREGAVVALVR